MKITKFGHSCLFVEAEGARILVDPGVYSSGFEELMNLDAILITHKHGDHCDVDAIVRLLEHNDSVTVYSNGDVKHILDEAGVPCVVPEHHAALDIAGVPVKVYEIHHENIYETVDPPQNTGFLIANKLYVTGDNVSSVPEDTVEILALPVVAPWGKLSEYLDFARAVKPRMVIPVHDAIGQPGFFAKHPKNMLPEFGIDVVVLENGVEVKL